VPGLIPGLRNQAARPESPRVTGAAPKAA
jgi:hypothetical protein